MQWFMIGEQENELKELLINNDLDLLKLAIIYCKIFNLHK